MKKTVRSVKKIRLYRIIAFLLIITLVSLVRLPDTIAADNGTQDDGLATLHVVVRTTEPSSDTPYIFRLTSSEISATDNMNMLRFVVWIRPNTPSIYMDTVTGEAIYTGEAIIKLPLGSYRIEHPSDTRWRTEDLNTANSEGTVDDSFNVSVIPKNNFAGFANNRVSFSMMDTSEEVTCIFNLKRNNERWLTASYVTPSYTG